jgi:hypothetical protein
MDSTICQVFGLLKQGVGFGYTKVRGYHPLLATRADTGEVLPSRLRGGAAFTARGACGFLAETFSRVRAAGATGLLTLRENSGFYSKAVLTTCRRAGVRFSVTARLDEAVQSGHCSASSWPRPSPTRANRHRPPPDLAPRFGLGARVESSVPAMLDRHPQFGDAASW